MEAADLGIEQGMFAQVIVQGGKAKGARSGLVSG